MNRIEIRRPGPDNQPMTAHWGVEDPAAVKGTDAQKRAAFRKTFCELEARIKIFVSLPIASLDRTRHKQRVDEIGRSQPDVV